MSSLSVQGRIYAIFDTQQIKDNFRKRDFVLQFTDNPNSNYPREQFVKFELVQDRCDILDQYSSGDYVDVSFNLKGREWTNQKGEKVYFNSLQAWKIALVGEAAHNDAGGPPPELMSSSPAAETPEDDLPF